MKSEHCADTFLQVIKHLFQELSTVHSICLDGIYDLQLK